MLTDKQQQKLKKRLKKQVEDMMLAEKTHKNIIGYTVYLGTTGIMLVLPIIVGAYIGVWLDNMLSGFSFSWTISLIVLGVFVGAINVYLFFRE